VKWIWPIAILMRAFDWLPSASRDATQSTPKATLKNVHTCTYADLLYELISKSGFLNCYSHIQAVTSSSATLVTDADRQISITATYHIGLQVGGGWHWPVPVEWAPRRRTSTSRHVAAGRPLALDLKVAAFWRNVMSENAAKLSCRSVYWMLPAGRTNSSFTAAADHHVNVSQNTYNKLNNLRFRRISVSEY